MKTVRFLMSGMTGRLRIGVTVLVMMIGLLAPVSTGVGQQASPPRTFDILKVVVNERLRDMVREFLGVSDQARFDEMHRSYAQAVQSLEERIQQESEAAGAREAERIFASQANPTLTPDWERYEQLQRAAREVYVRGHRESDTLLNNWLMSLIAEFPEEVAAEEIQAAARLIRRQTLLQEPNPDRDGNYFEALNVLALFEQARTEGGELSGISIEEPPVGEQQTALVEALERYELAIDQLLQEQLKKSREFPSSDFKSRMAPGEPEYEAVQRNLARRFRRHYQVFREACSAIGTFASDTAGIDARTAWEQRVDRAFCPELLRPRIVELALNWLASRDDVTDEQRAALDVIRTEYAAERSALTRSAIETGVVLLSRRLVPTDPEYARIKSSYGRKLLLLHDLSRRTMQQICFNVALSDVVKAELQTFVIAQATSPTVVGPRIDRATLDRIGQWERYQKGLMP